MTANPFELAAKRGRRTGCSWAAELSHRVMALDLPEMGAISVRRDGQWASVRPQGASVAFHEWLTTPPGLVRHTSFGGFSRASDHALARPHVYLSTSLVLEDHLRTAFVVIAHVDAPGVLKELGE
jgi:hypothetical protein